MSWNELTIKQFIDIQDAQKLGLDEFSLSLLICQIVYPELNLTINTPFKNIKKYIFEINNLGDIQYLEKLPDKISLKGNNYKVDYSVEQFTASQYIDFTNALKKSDVLKQLSAVIIPEGQKYNEGYNIVKLQNDLQELDCVTALSILNAFSQVLQSIHKNFSQLFNSSEEAPEKTPLTKWGILPFILKVVEISNTKFEEVMGWSICQVFYLVCYSLDLDKMQKKELERWKRAH